MRIDISELTLEIKDSIMATVLVCDRTLRAWTFLESAKARQNTQLLCRGNRTISFLEVGRDVLAHDRIDLAIFSNTVLHILHIQAL